MLSVDVQLICSLHWIEAQHTQMLLVLKTTGLSHRVKNLGPSHQQKQKIFFCSYYSKYLKRVYGFIPGCHPELSGLQG